MPSSSRDSADPKLLAPIRHRGLEAHQALALVRSRDLLVRSRTKLINHVRGAVKAWGAKLPATTAPAFHHRVADDILEPLRSALTPLLEVIGELTARIRAADRAVEELCASYPETTALRQVVGVGPLTALCSFNSTAVATGSHPVGSRTSCAQRRPRLPYPRVWATCSTCWGGTTVHPRVVTTPHELLEASI